MTEQYIQSGNSIDGNDHEDTISPDFAAIIDLVTGGKPVEQIHAEKEEGLWPFAISEQEMRETVAAVNAEVLDEKNGIN